MDQLQIDNVSRPGSMLMASLDDNAYMQHGELVTRIGFDKVEEMTLEEFKRREVPRLGKENEDSYVIRDSVSKSLTMIKGDSVVRFNNATFQDVPLDMFANSLVSSTAKRVEGKLHTYDIKRSLVSHMEPTAQYNQSFVVRIPSMKRVMRHSIFPDPLEIYTPDVWFGLNCDEDCKTYDKVRLAIVKQEERNPKDTKLYHWAMGNSYMTGRLCLGNGTPINWNNNVYTPGTLLEQMEQHFFSAEFNLDLTSRDNDLAQSINTTYAKYEKQVKLSTKNQEKLRDMKGSVVFSLLALLTIPGVWREISYPPLRETTTHKFLTGSID